VLATVDDILAHQLQQGCDCIRGARVAPNHKGEISSICNSGTPAVPGAAMPMLAAAEITSAAATPYQENT
jgi:hypothetical protein